jgi:hypothetical protein
MTARPSSHRSSQNTKLVLLPTLMKVDAKNMALSIAVSWSSSLLQEQSPLVWLNQSHCRRSAPALSRSCIPKPPKSSGWHTCCQLTRQLPLLTSLRPLHIKLRRILSAALITLRCGTMAYRAHERDNGLELRSRLCRGNWAGTSPVGSQGGWTPSPSPQLNNAGTWPSSCRWEAFTKKRCVRSANEWKRSDCGRRSGGVWGQVGRRGSWQTAWCDLRYSLIIWSLVCWAARKTRIKLMMLKTW